MVSNYFDLDDSGRDKDFNKIGIQISEDITDDKGNYDENKFKAAIKGIIEEIINKNY